MKIENIWLKEKILDLLYKQLEIRKMSTIGASAGQTDWLHMQRERDGETHVWCKVYYGDKASKHTSPLFLSL